jgi:Cu/Zn superoxide dismutase
MINRKSLAFAAAAAAVAVFVGCGSDSDEPTTPVDTSVTYTAQLSAANEVPAPTGSPTATGTATLKLTTDKLLTVTINIVGNLTSNLTLSHIHGATNSTPTTASSVVFDFVPAMGAVISAGTRTGTVLQTTYDLKLLTPGATSVLKQPADSVIAWMNSGRAYVNVHTATNGPGEIRGTVVKQ